jgi:hypothetical protein
MTRLAIVVTSARSAVTRRAASWPPGSACSPCAPRAAVYGVEEEKLGEFYAQRTLLKREVLPEHIAAAVFQLTQLTQTTGLHILEDPPAAAAAG